MRVLLYDILVFSLVKRVHCVVLHSVALESFADKPLVGFGSWFGILIDLSVNDVIIVYFGLISNICDDSFEASSANFE